MSSDAKILSGQSVDGGAGAVPYAPITAMLRDLVQQSGADAVMAAAGPGRDTLKVLLPELGDRPTSPQAAGAERLHEVVAVLLESFARDRPLVVILEDLHWVDGATLTVLRFLIRAVRAGRIMFVLSYRSDDVPRGHPLRPFLTELERGRLAQRIELDRLDRSQVEEQARSILGHPPGGAMLANVFERSEGVPFFVEELVGLDDGRGCNDLPDTLRDVLLARYERLSEPSQRFLRLLSAGGGTVSHGLLASVYEGGASDLDEAAREAVFASILIADDSDYTFRHALVREAIHADLLPGERSRFHAAYAMALEKTALYDCSYTEVAGHWLAAHNQERAFPAALIAMEEARKSYAYVTAAEMGERALELWQHVSDAEGLAGMTHVDLLAKTASALRNAGDDERALAMVNSAIDESADHTTTRFARLLRDKAYYLANLNQPGSIPLLEQALALVPPGVDDVLRGTLLNTLASRFMIEARLDRAIELADEALELALTIHSSAQASIASNLAGLSRADRGEVTEGVAQLDRARELAEGDPSALLRYRVNSSDLRFHLGQFEAALEIAQEGMARARQLGVERAVGVIMASNAVDPLLALGRWDQAEVLIDRALALAPPTVSRTYVRRAKLWLMLWRGDPEAATARYNAWRSSMAYDSEMQNLLSLSRVLAEIALAAGRVDEAWDHAAVVISDRHRPLPGYDLPLLVVAAQVLARRRADAGNSPELDTAESALRAVLESERFWPTWDTWSAQFEAELGGGGTGTGAEEWRTALDAASSGPAQLRPYGLFRLGQALVAAGERTQATDVLREAHSAATELGAGLITRRVADLAARAGLALDDTLAPRSTDAVELTSRELQVLHLISEGLSNRQIGERLYISAKTASVHVSAILRKLGASSRTEAVFLASRELV